MVTVDRVGSETVPVDVQDPSTARNLVAAAAKKFKTVTKQSRIYHGVTGAEMTAEVRWEDICEAFVVLSSKSGWKGAERLSAAYGAAEKVDSSTSVVTVEPVEEAELEGAVTPAMLLEAALSTRAQGVVLFWKETQNNGYLSNWARSPIVIEGIHYSCVEQWIMASKARVCRDEEVVRQIMASTSPRKQKALGRSLDSSMVKRYWTNHNKYEVQLEGAKAKFQQHDRLAVKLLASGLKQIAEASPSDSIYGIGLAPSDPQAQDPENWKGANLLGKALMQVREELRARVLSAHPGYEAQLAASSSSTRTPYQGAVEEDVASSCEEMPSSEADSD